MPPLHEIVQQVPQQLVIGLTQGAIYALIALGYTMVYGVLRLINFAHGDVYMLGAYAGFYVAFWSGASTALQAGRNISFWLVGLIFVAAMGFAALFGVGIELFAYRPLRNSPRLAALITAIGVSMLLEFGGQGIFGSKTKGFPDLAPHGEGGKAILLVNTPNFTLSLLRGIIIVVAGLLMAGLTFIVLKTRFGRAMRAVSLDQSAAALMGINTNVIISATFAIGSALAAAGGVLNATYQGSITPLMGLMVGLKAFVAAVLGGIGSIPGAALGGLLMGLSETGVVVIGKSEYQDAIAFAILILVLLVRPAGLLGKTTAEKV
jgi:branched-chain amino acid transport system permease protein